LDLRIALNPRNPAAPPFFAMAARGIAVLTPLIPLTIAAYLRFYRLGEGGLGNSFYAASVRSMRHSLHNFFFVAYDPLATFSIDKPPLAPWLQTLSTFLFGFKGFALVLPQAVAGVAAVALLIWVARRLQNDSEAIVAGCVVAVLPASVLVSRNNTMDTLVMALSLSTLALLVWAGACGRLLPVALAAITTGLAFNTKGFEAFVALPGILVFFMLAARLPFRDLALRLGLFASVATVLGLSWIVAVSLVPNSSRPLVLNSDGNSEINLTFGYNGFDRILGHDGFQPANALTTVGVNAIAPGVFYGGNRAALRVFGEFPGPLIAVAVPLALAGALILAGDLFDRQKRASAALWLLWLAAGLVVFSASRLGSPHYLESFSPALAACIAVALSGARSQSRLTRLIALAGASASAVFAFERLTDLTGVGETIRVLAVAGLIVALLSALAALLRGAPLPSAIAAFPAGCVVAVLFLISYEAVHKAPIEGVQPGAVFMSLDRSRDVLFDSNSFAYSYITGNYDYLRPAISYLQARSRPGQYLAAVRTFYMASPFIAEQDLPLLPIYSEFRERPELPLAKLLSLIDYGEIEYFLVSMTALRQQYPEAAALIQEMCPTDLSRVARLPPQAGLQLFHCE
jgi:4-amino-4-deoxy-L-arabinose transferase-like glycosyltransferase